MPFTITRTVQQWADIIGSLDSEELESLWPLIDLIDDSINTVIETDYVTIEFTDTQRIALEQYGVYCPVNVDGIC